MATMGTILQGFEMIENILKLLDSKQNIKVWFRVDDMGLKNKTSQKCINLFKKFNVPMYAAVIPNKLCKWTILQINNYCKCYVIQHGYNHKNYSVKTKNEFPRSRKTNEVKKCIANGQKKLDKNFQCKNLKIFCPPWYEFSSKHIRVLEDFKGISSVNNIKYKNFDDINVNVDIINWTQNDHFAGEEFVYSQLKKVKNNVLGFVIHHRTMGIKGFQFLEELLKYFSSRNDCDFIDFSVKYF